MDLKRALGKMSARNIFANAEMWNRQVKQGKFDTALGGYEVGAGIDQPAIAQMMGISPQATMAYIQFENADMERKRAEKERDRQRRLQSGKYARELFTHWDDTPEMAKRMFGMWGRNFQEESKPIQDIIGNSDEELMKLAGILKKLGTKALTPAEKQTADIKKRTLALGEDTAEIRKTTATTAGKTADIGLIKAKTGKDAKEPSVAAVKFDIETRTKKAVGEAITRGVPLDEAESPEGIGAVLTADERATFNAALKKQGLKAFYRTVEGEDGADASKVISIVPIDKEKGKPITKPRPSRATEKDTPKRISAIRDASGNIVLDK